MCVGGKKKDRGKLEKNLLEYSFKMNSRRQVKGFHKKKT